MPAAVLAQAAMRDKGATPGRRESLEAIAARLAELATEFEGTGGAR